MAGIQGRQEVGMISGAPTTKKKSIADAYSDQTERQLGDYGDIMGGYRDLARNNTFNPITYNSSPDVMAATANLKNFSDTGGYSDSDIKNIRERSVSPIRSIYARGQENLMRNKAIQGGYSPGYAAALVKMSRDASQQVSDITGNVNAQLAQNIAQNKLAGSQAYGSLASSEAGRTLDTSKFNADLEGQTRDRNVRLLDSQRGLYGTTPALADMFGRQALESARLNEQGRQFDQGQAQQAALSLIARRIASGGYMGTAVA